ncbi:gluconate 5-dehydrogenase [Yersinia mollaretii]|nr:gluconate 5-dehydrogenase [Yersinia mollaretii]
MRDDFTASLRSVCSLRNWHFINNLKPISQSDGLFTMRGC